MNGVHGNKSYSGWISVKRNSCSRPKIFVSEKSLLIRARKLILLPQFSVSVKKMGEG